MNQNRSRYVELSYELPPGLVLSNGSKSPGHGLLWFAVLCEADSPRDAVIVAKGKLTAAHPEATKVEEWMQRVVTLRRYQAIESRMTAETWKGWTSS